MYIGQCIGDVFQTAFFHVRIQGGIFTVDGQSRCDKADITLGREFIFILPVGDALRFQSLRPVKYNGITIQCEDITVTGLGAVRLQIDFIGIFGCFKCRALRDGGAQCPAIGLPFFGLSQFFSLGIRCPAAGVAVGSTVAGGTAGGALSCCVVVLSVVAGAVTAVAAVSASPGAASLSAGITVAGGGVMPVHSERPFGSVWHCHEPAACGVVHVTDSRVHSTSRTGKRMLMSVKTGGRTGRVAISDV